MKSGPRFQTAFTLLELLIAMSVMLLVVGTLAGLAKGVQLGFEHGEAYGTITQHHDMRYPGRPYQAATQLTNPDFAVWGTAFGAKGFTIHDESEVESVIAEALAVKTQPVVVHVHTSLQQISAWRRRG